MKVQLKQVRDIKPAAYNPRIISEGMLDKLRTSMQEFGYLSGLIVNLRTGHLVGGHQRLKHLDLHGRSRSDMPKTTLAQSASATF